MVPQTFREPYWTLMINEMYNVQQDSHLFFSYTYGRQIDNEFHKKVLAIVEDGQYSSQMPGRSPRRKDENPFLIIPTTEAK